LLPALANVWLVGALALHPAAPAAGAVAVSLTRYPVTPLLSVAVTVIETVNAVDVAGIVNVTAGAVLSLGMLAASPGKDPKLISVMFEKPSLSESKFSIAAKLYALALKSLA
jgi:hypothetical protein